MQTLIPTIFADDDSQQQQWNSVIGIVTAICGNILISFALNIQRFAHIRLDRDHKKSRRYRGKNYGTQGEIAEQRAQLNLDAPSRAENDLEQQAQYHDSPLSESFHTDASTNSTIREKIDGPTDKKTYLSSPYWWMGIVLMTVGEAGNFLAYGFAPASIVSPLGVVALVSNCIIAPCLLKEKFRQRDFWGVVVAVAGAVVVVLSAKTSENKMGPHRVWGAITRWEFETYLGITVGLIIILMWASGKYGEKSILIDLGLVALFGGYTALSTKGVASLLSDTLWRALTFPISYVLVFILVATALLQIRYVNRALQRFDSTQVIPTQFVLFTLSVIIGSAVLYRDFESATAERFGKFIGGCLLTFSGVYLITSGRPQNNDVEEEDSVNDEESAIDLVDDEQDHQDVSGEQVPSKMSVASFQADGAASPETQPKRLSRQQSGGRSPLSSTPNSNLLENPWMSSRESISSASEPRLQSMSSPLLPSDARRPQGPSHSQSRQLGEHLRADRPSTPSKNSSSRMLPGPLMSPLSSSLKAIVADDLRKGMSPRPRRRPGLSSLRKSRSQRIAIESADDVSFPSKNAQESGDGHGSPSSIGKGRSQSLTANLGDFFQFKRVSNKGKENDVGALERSNTQGSRH